VSALVGAVLAGAVCGLVGVFVVLRSMSFAGHGLTHAVFGGAAIAEATGAAYLLGAGLWGGVAAVAIWAITRHRAVTADAAIGVVTVASFAIGVLVQSRAGGTEHGLEALLFGEADRVRGGDVVLVAVVAVIVVLTVISLRRPLTFSSFDPDVARVHGLRVGAIDLVLMLCVAATVVATARIIGTLLATSLLVLPALAARLSACNIFLTLWTKSSPTSATALRRASKAATICSKFTTRTRLVVVPKSKAQSRSVTQLRTSGLCLPPSIRC